MATLLKILEENDSHWSSMARLFRSENLSFLPESGVSVPDILVAENIEKEIEDV